MTTAGRLLVLTLAVVATPVLAETLRCPRDSVKVGPACVDKYEASVWSILAANTALIAKVKVGTATASDLLAGGGRRSKAPARPASRPPSKPPSPRPATGRPRSTRPRSRPCCRLPASRGFRQIRRARSRASAWLGRRVAAGGGGDTRPRHGQRHQRLQHLDGRRAGEHGLAVELQVRLGRVRHGGERGRVGSGLG